MDTPIFSWIKADVAIEIIGKMIAGQVAQLHEQLKSFEQAEFDLTNEAVITHFQQRLILSNCPFP